jgi:DNA helicase II / ATP-dependent DNA helicase PcrA
MLNKLIIAAAGSGKTRKLISESLEIKDASILITTYTEANANEIKNRFIKENGSVPENVTIQTWFSLLIEHGIKPYQSVLFDGKIKGMLLVNSQSGFRFKNAKGFPMYWGEADFKKHYFTEDNRIYSDKLSKLVCKLNDSSNEKVVERLVSIFPVIFIDECQDLAGYDLDIIKLLSKKANQLTLVCDPRQVTYLTHNERKYAKYKNGLIADFILNECKKSDFEIDSITLSHSYRSNQQICNYSNKLFPEIDASNSVNNEETEHDGIYLVDKSKINEYLKKYNPVQLRWNVSTNLVNEDFAVYNFGQAKGLTFERVLIFPTVDMIGWMQNHDYNLKDEARAKFYVGLTRAKFSVGIVCDTSLEFSTDGIEKYD